MKKKCAEPKYPAVWLEITTWRGTSPGAEHYYGRLIKNSRGPGEDFEEDVEQPFTRKHAQAFNEKHAEFGLTKRKAGGKTNEFYSEQEVRKRAIGRFNQLFPDGILIEANHGSLSARPLLAWPEWFDAQAKRANDLATEWERINGYEGNEKRAGEIDNEWQKILVEFIGEYL